MIEGLPVETTRGAEEALRNTVKEHRAFGSADALFYQGDPSIREVEKLEGREEERPV